MPTTVEGVRSLTPLLVTATMQLEVKMNIIGGNTLIGIGMFRPLFGTSMAEPMDNSAFFFQITCLSAAYVSPSSAALSAQWLSSQQENQNGRNYRQRRPVAFPS